MSARAALAMTPPMLSIEDWRLLDRLQDGLPVVAEPFAVLEQELGVAVTDIIARIAHWLDTGLLTRFGPLFDAERIGGALRLCAMTVPAADFERIAALVNGHAEVAHNYERRHRLNMWFVLASETPSRLDAVTAEIEAQTGLRVLALPKLKEYFIGLKVTPPPETGLPETPLPERAPCGTDASPPDAANRALILALQAGLPIVPRPFEAAARMTGLTEADTIARLAALSERGAIRRIAAVPNHYALGWTENAMTVWDVDEAAIDAIGAAIGHQPFVSHCYRRPRFAPEWPYSLFAMVHGRTRAEVEAKIAALAALCGPALRASDRLYSTRILKKTGLRITG